MSHIYLPSVKKSYFVLLLLLFFLYWCSEVKNFLPMKEMNKVIYPGIGSTMLKEVALHTAQAFINKDHEAFYFLKDVLYFHC